MLSQYLYHVASAGCVGNGHSRSCGTASQIFFLYVERVHCQRHLNFIWLISKKIGISKVTLFISSLMNIKRPNIVQNKSNMAVLELNIERS